MINAWLGEWSDALPAPKYSIIRANNITRIWDPILDAQLITS